ncbi:MAG: 5-guanidino-2-oxopentanoate decarboxylase [Rhodospirillales bacterium]
MTTCGEALIRGLEAYGVDTVFGIPGVHTLELYRGLADSSIRHVTPRHEQGAGFMADGYARVSGKPGVCFIISGPGMTNIATAMGQAYSDSVPMLVISSVTEAASLGKGEGHLHELPDQRALVAGVAAFSHSVRDAKELPTVLARAFDVFDAARPRPVHIEIPIDLLGAPANEVAISRHDGARPPEPAQADIEKAAAWLHEADSIAVVAGGGAQDAPDAVRALADRLGAPVSLTIDGKGLLPPDHPLLAGTFVAFEPWRKVMDAAEVTLAIGTELGETDFDFYRDGGPRVGGKLIRVDIDPGQIDKNLPADLGLVGDAGAVIERLLEALGPGSPDTTASVATAARVVAESGALHADWMDRHRPYYAAIAEAFPDPVIVGDSTQPVYGANNFFNASRPRSYFTSSTGYGTLGYGLPAAIGAKIAVPERPVICVAGDGGFLFSASELVAGVEARAGVPILLWNNNSYLTIKEYMEQAQIKPEGVIDFSPDFGMLARACGCETVRLGGSDGLVEALKDAHGRDRPTLIEIMAV